VVIIGGGIAGLAAAERLTRADRPIRVTVLEAQQRLGGVITSERADGFVIEHGPDVMVASKPAGIALATRLGLEDRVVTAGASVGSAYVMRRGRLVRLPAGMSGLVPGSLGALLETSLLSPAGKLRALLEPLVPPRRDHRDESIESFVRRRLGRELYERMADPLLSGIYAGDGSRLSVDATFPQLRAAEREHGSLARARRSRPAPRGGFVAFRDGLGEMVDALAQRLAASAVEVRTGVTVTQVRAAGSGYALATASETTEADAVIIATPAPVAATLCRSLNPSVARSLGEIEHVSTAIVTLAFPISAVERPLDATGYVVPRAEAREVFASTWSSAKFAGRAPSGFALFRSFLGGAGRERSLDRTDDELVRLAIDELRMMLGVRGEPSLRRVTRWNAAMPQYAIGHRERVGSITSALEPTPRVALAGNVYGGVGIPDCIASGERAAERVLAGLVASPGAEQLPAEARVVPAL
jgi:protoporphyrinogen/coproporphyrinogen III oxidase